jgi:hypothetical protein
LLSSLIEQQYNRLGGLTSLGQNAAAGVGNAGMSTGANISNLLGRQGQAQAGGILGQQGAMTGGINQAFGAVQGAGGFGNVFGGASRPFSGTAISGPTSMSQADYAAFSGF